MNWPSMYDLTEILEMSNTNLLIQCITFLALKDWSCFVTSADAGWKSFNTMYYGLPKQRKGSWIHTVSLLNFFYLTGADPSQESCLLGHKGWLQSKHGPSCCKSVAGFRSIYMYIMTLWDMRTGFKLYFCTFSPPVPVWVPVEWARVGDMHQISSVTTWHQDCHPHLWGKARCVMVGYKLHFGVE